MGIAEELASLLGGEFPRLVPIEPENENCLHGLLYLYLASKRYYVNYTGGRARPDLVVRKPRGRVEVPIEVKLTSSASVVDRGVEQLMSYMKGTDWRTGILFVWDNGKRAAAYSRARELKTVKKWGRTILLVAVKPKS
ncbi:hypothetical protein Pyrde_1913 [Pyrodictium delaneyi]|uniref:Restriction endonuclease type IV Mrr domain-containing protein n=1 Tax=Pyrodictium delaneyi TaxID=1273541 RepID=A0A0P0N6B4_9CREN|nr:hypothetical protein [Pyrodictium delaneyi]ALL01956.1 hypothetical protein Pyrde_1913 [Pyrodictium delaneyi]OWJ54873.1 hypothetical protein Pdsh_03950 [Pyrodictium delaneyi]